MLIRETSEFEDAPHDRYTLWDLQRLMVKFGPSHFNPKGNNPIHYLQVLLLTAQFERVSIIGVDRLNYQRKSVARIAFSVSIIDANNTRIYIS